MGVYMDSKPVGKLVSPTVNDELGKIERRRPDEYGVTFDDRIHTERDWGLKLLSVYIPMPDPKTQTIDISGGDGSIDLTEIKRPPCLQGP